MQLYKYLYDNQTEMRLWDLIILAIEPSKNHVKLIKILAPVSFLYNCKAHY